MARFDRVRERRRGGGLAGVLTLDLMGDERTYPRAKPLKRGEDYERYDKRPPKQTICPHSARRGRGTRRAPVPQSPTLVNPTLRGPQPAPVQEAERSPSDERATLPVRQMLRYHQLMRNAMTMVGVLSSGLKT